MRRKSARNAAKASPEKVKKESPTRKSRRQSKRRKRSSSASSDDSQDERPLKQVPPPETPEPVKSHSPSDDENVTVEQPVWKVTPANSSTGEIQKLKICLTRPSPSTPERTERSSRRHRNKSGDDSPEEKPRRTRFRGSEGSSTQEDEKNSEVEEKEERRGKGKSKGKHKSKVEKTAQLNEAETEMQSEISENVQVTPQSPSAIDIPVDNDESVNTEVENVPAQNNNVEITEREETCNDELKQTIENSQKIDQIQINEVNTSTHEEAEPIESVQNSSPENEISEQKQMQNEQPFASEAPASETTPQEPVSELEISTPEEQVTSEAPENEIKSPKPQATEQESAEEQINSEVPETKLKLQECQASEPDITEEQTDSGAAETERKLQEYQISEPAITDKQVDSEAPTELKLQECQASEPAITKKQVNSEAPETELKLQKCEASESAIIEEQIDSEEVTKPQADETSAQQSPTQAERDDISENVVSELEEAVDDSVEKASIEAELGSEVEERSEISEVPTDVQIDEQFETSGEVVQESVETSAENTRMFNEKDEETSAGFHGFRASSAQREETNEALFVEQMDVDVSESENFQNLKEELKSNDQPVQEESPREIEAPKPEKIPFKRLKPEEKKRKWGTDSTGLNTLFANIVKVDLDTIKELCPDLQFLEEDEVKLESVPPRERKRSVDQKISNRKVSIDDSEMPTFRTQTSVNSTTSEPTSEQDDNSNIIALNRKISIVDDTASKLKPPPSPAKHPVSAVLYITNLVRPFTLKQLKELLERTGKIKEEGFWTDRIKSKCYVHYDTVEEAEATRNALHGVQWPIGNGKKLIIDYSTPEDMEVAQNPPAPPVPVPVAETKLPDKENEVPVPVQRPEDDRTQDRRDKRRTDAQVREWDIGKEDLNRDRSRSRSRERMDKRKHSHRSHTPVEDFITKKQRKLEEAVPQKLMDDLFQKTKATPCIYWQPLTPEEIATKQQQRLMRMAEHKRRMEETSRNPRGNDFGRGGPFRRRNVPG